MLAIEATKTQATKNIADPEWWLQQKCDGDRILVRSENGVVTFLNRQGEPKAKAIPPGVQSFFTIPDGLWYFDGELVGDQLWIFDLLIDSVISTETPYIERYAMLEVLFAKPEWASDAVKLLPTARTAEEKMALTVAVSEGNGEGWMLRHRSMPYVCGPSRSTKLLKIKRTRTMDVIIGKHHLEGKENAELKLLDPRGKSVPVGRCSLIGKPDVDTGDVVEVKFLYVGANDRLYQPTLLRVRDDKSPEECTIDQLDPHRVNKSIIIPPALAGANA